MLNLKIQDRYDAKTTYLGFVETINPNAGYHEKQIIPKVVVLHRVKDKLEPIFPDYEYYNLIQAQPAVSYLSTNEKTVFGYLSHNQLQKAIQRTGLKEADRLTKEKVLKKVA